jgi:solute carrier family 25 (mitochondrial phosphate transporter), member 23/24/25/41
LGSEGDVIVQEEAGTGTEAIMSFIKPFFAILFQIGQRPRPRPEWKLDAAFAPDSSSKTSVLEQASVAAHSATSKPVLLVPEVTAAEPDVLPDSDWTKWDNFHMVLIACIPSTGYFAAGAIAGIVSRTATAPLDRLKVYLIAQTKSPTTNTLARSHGLRGYVAVAARNTAFACRDLWNAGGFRSLYAGG